ncbi:MAG: HAD family hydrolase [Chlorobium sp.]|jgi:phosphoglycolate phosphatase|uniref:HAD family hydrolase n=1 Tax=Chlorobium sp. TaxID=1095 RepID=UPI0025BDA0F3|nr:HAD family hydrolase [Chlorobium sp.]MCF8216405.1 HAD family hydrolase [Chlorobium sp.]MCF8271308.1 HAD family hydrolase [Chlorobium sp.]MCF8287682.1 HAD family hydrolase [Chlorobium sp.]MCF8291221.1 HAD family hydrolase [Chlorobium sp.]MCF8385357.1 HAD family hydrolase [Chlorobium sp.]
MPFKSVIFDLDGTLLDTLEDVVNTLNAVLDMHNYPTHGLDKGRYLVGHGMRELVRKALPEGVATEELIDSLLKDLMIHYSSNWNRHSKPYPGIGDLLDDLTRLGMKKAILSNKADRFTQLCAKELLAEWPFDAVIGHHSAIAHKPDPAGALMIAGMLGHAPDEILYVGDSGIDMQTASRAGMYPLGVLWGFRPAEELLEFGAKKLVETPAEISKFLGVA